MLVSRMAAASPASRAERWASARRWSSWSAGEMALSCAIPCIRYASVKMSAKSRDLCGLDEHFFTRSQAVTIMSIREGRAVAHDTNAVVGKSVVHLGQLILRHVAAGAVLCGNTAGLHGDVICGRRVPRICMALQTSVVVVGGLAHQRFVRVMTGNTSEAP